MSPTHIAILGGGITGLTAAFHLSKRFPSARVTLLERTERVGGWIRSKRVEVDLPGGDVGNALLELGPRTLRPQSRALLELVNVLGLGPQLIVTPKNAPASTKRFLYIPDSRRRGLTPIPSSMLGYLTSPLSLIMVPSLLREPFRRANRPTAAEEDESLDSLLSRRFGAEFARVLGSSLVHGIYAADSRKLSVRAAFAPLWDAEASGSIVRGLFRARISDSEASSEKYEIGDLEQKMNNIAVYSFRDGLEVLVDALRRKLEATSDVQILTDTVVSGIHHVDGSFRITTASGPLHPSHVVSTVPLRNLHPLISEAPGLPYLTSNHSSSVTLASFIFAVSPTLIHPEGFGYLIPRPKAGYHSSENPEGVLGVVFDSCSVGAQDRPRGSLTKMTMMLGGPYPRFSTNTGEMGSVLLERLQHHLGRRLPRPAYFGVWHHDDCIPIPGPGHLQRMDELKRVLQGDPWRGRMEVIGAGVGGVSLGDCVEQGRRAGRDWM